MSTTSPRKMPKPSTSTRPIDERVADAIAQLKKKSSRTYRDGLARYAIPADNALGVAMKDIQTIAKSIGRDHALVDALWKTRIYEARMLCAYVDEPARVTPAQMDRWCRDFDNWAICDTLCFSLFERTPHAFAKVESWSKKRGEFEKRAAFALLASLALHDKKCEDEPFLRALALIEREAGDDRNFVKKAVSWALRGIGKRKSPALKKAAIALSRKLAESHDASARWIGKDALKQLAR